MNPLKLIYLEYLYNMDETRALQIFDEAKPVLMITHYDHHGLVEPDGSITLHKKARDARQRGYSLYQAGQPFVIGHLVEEDKFSPPTMSTLKS